QFNKVAWLALLLTSGCIRLERISTATPTALQTSTAQPTLAVLATSTPDYGWTDVSDLMEDVCFEAALNTMGQVFNIPNANTLDAFYTQIDRSNLCEDPINHKSYSFNDGEII